MRRLLEGLSSEPATVPPSPVFAGLVGAAMPQQEREQLLACPHQLQRGVGPGAHQVANRLVHLVGDPNRRQVAGAMQDRQLLRVAPVGS